MSTPKGCSKFLKSETELRPGRSVFVRMEGGAMSLLMYIYLLCCMSTAAAFLGSEMAFWILFHVKCGLLHFRSHRHYSSARGQK